jgi:hypothetical protein
VIHALGELGDESRQLGQRRVGHRFLRQVPRGLGTVQTGADRNRDVRRRTARCPVR